MSETHVVHCRAPRKVARYDGQRCGSFVARVPWPFVTRIIERHEDAQADAIVVRCSRCGATHEIRDRNIASPPTGGILSA